jgi:hypothetical protein
LRRSAPCFEVEVRSTRVRGLCESTNRARGRRPTELAGGIAVEKERLKYPILDDSVAAAGEPFGIERPGPQGSDPKGIIVNAELCRPDP